MELKRKIKLSPVVAFRRSEQNPYMYGLQMKRDLTVKEACHIYRNIFLFDLDLSLSWCDAEEKKEYYPAITKAMNNYIKGDIGWSTLCDEAYCYDEDDGWGPSVASCLKLTEYLQQKGIV